MSRDAALPFALLLAGCDVSSAAGPAAVSASAAVSAPAAVGISASVAAEQPALAVAELFSTGRQPVVTGWEASPAKLDSAYCQTCHAQVHAAWTQSMHAQAWSDPVFQRAFALESRAWCKNCHSPLQAAQTGALPLSQGINCATCHVRSGEILGASSRAETLGAHAVSPVSGFESAELCAGCHQFNFPASLGEVVEYSDVPMQNTVTEWRASGAAGCNQCHQDSHAVRGPHDRGWLEQLVTRAVLSSSSAGVLSLEVQLRPRGHNLPTGDNFHSFVLELATQADFGQPFVRKRYGHELGKGFVSAFVVSDRALLQDRSLPASASALSLTFDRPDAPRVYARLRFFQHDSVIDHVSAAEAETALNVWQQSFELANL